VGECEELSAQGCEEHRSAGRSCNATVDSTGRSGRTRRTLEDGPGCEDGTQGKGKEAKLSYNGNLLVENRNGLIVNTEVFEPNGTAERDAALVIWNRFRARSK